jgi:hypothetical protein
MKASARHRGDRDRIDGTPRTELVTLAARAIIDSCDDVILWKMLRVGFAAWRPIVRRQFRRDAPGLRLTDAELAWIYCFIEQHVARIAARAQQPADAPPPLSTTRPRDPADEPVTIETDTRSPTVH